MDDEDPRGASVYRFYAADQLVYLGVTGGLPRRLDAHAGRDWWRTCDRLTLVHYATREEAETAEVEGIRTEHPAYNIVHNHHLPPMAGRENTEMDVYTSRAFQIAYQRLEEPVVVYAKSRKLGTWYPKGTEPAGDGYVEQKEQDADRRSSELDALENEVRQLKRQLAAREVVPAAVDATSRTEVTKPASNVRAASTRPFTPVPKPGGKK